MTAIQVRRLDVIDSPYRCRDCGKRMVFIPRGAGVGEERNRHECLHCGRGFRE